MASKIYTSLDLAGNEIINARKENQATPPAAGNAGRMLFNTTSALVQFDNGSTWRSLAPLDGPAFTGSPTAPNPPASNRSTRLATTAWVQGEIDAFGAGDMAKSVYDTNDDGKVNSADTADAVPWSGVTSKPTTLAGFGITDAYTQSQVDTALGLKLNASAVSTFGGTLIDDADAATARTTLGLGSLATQNDIGTVSNDQLANQGEGTIKGRAAGAGTGSPNNLTAAQVKSILGLTSSDLGDFTSAVNTQVAAYWDSIAGTDADIDTIRELMDLVLSNESGLNNLIGRHNEDFGDGTSTSFAINHGLGSLDVSVEVYDKSSGDTVICGITRTDSNTVTIVATPAPGVNELRVVIKQ